MADDNESLRMLVLVLLIVIGLLVFGMAVIEPAPTHLCPRDYFDTYGRCP